MFKNTARISNFKKFHGLKIEVDLHKNQIDESLTN